MNRIHANEAARVITRAVREEMPPAQAAAFLVTLRDALETLAGNLAMEAEENRQRRMPRDAVAAGWLADCLKDHAPVTPGPLTHEDFAEAAESAERARAYLQAEQLWLRACEICDDDQQHRKYLDHAIAVKRHANAEQA